MSPNYHDYKVHFNQLLGKGGFCSVYKATDPTGRIVAMKIPNQAAGDDTWNSENSRKFQHEAEVWTRLCKRKIPGVVQVFEHGIKPHPWIAMELLESGTLRKRIEKGLTIPEALAIIKPVIHCLSRVHLTGVIHRDLKPENILFTRDGAPKLADWGLGKVLLEPTLSSEGIKGTLKYLAPEQFRLEEEDRLDHQTDIYQLGAVLYEMLTGKTLFPTNNVGVLVNCIQNQQIVPPLHHNPKIPEHVNEVLLRCLAKRKEDRFRDMGAVLDRLERRAERSPPPPPPTDEAGESKRLLTELHKWLNLLKEAGADISKGVKIYNTLREYHRLEWYDRVKKEAALLLKELNGKYEQALKDQQARREALVTNVQNLFETCIAEGLDVSAFYKGNAEAMKDYRQGDLASAEKRFRALKGKLEHVIGEKRRREEEEEEEEALLHGAATVQNAVSKQQAWARKLGVETSFTSPTAIKFMLVPAGTFTMGSKKSSDATPHQVTLSKPFYLGKYQVTQAQWKVVMGNTPSNFKGATRPVEQVSWKDCQEFIKKLNAKERTNKYRLPTEAEREYACRAGSTTTFCFGDDKGRLGEYAWFNNNSGDETHPVGQKKPNTWKIHDMHGNVWEWCQDWWYGSYPKNAVTDPVGPGQGSIRVIRGGGWDDPAEYCSAAFRDGGHPGNRYDFLGFRLARSF